MQNAGVKQPSVQGQHKGNRVQHVLPEAAIPWTEADMSAVVTHVALSLDAQCTDPIEQVMQKLIFKSNIMMHARIIPKQSN